MCFVSSSLLPLLLVTTDPFIVSMILPFLAFPDWHFSLSNMHLRFLHGLMAHFVLALKKNIPLYECTTVYLSIHLLKDILVSSEFWHNL